jgi:hypothetical protein
MIGFHPGESIPEQSLFKLTSGISPLKVDFVKSFVMLLFLNKKSQFHTADFFFTVILILPYIAYILSVISYGAIAQNRGKLVGRADIKNQNTSLFEIAIN